MISIEEKIVRIGAAVKSQPPITLTREEFLTKDMLALAQNPLVIIANKANPIVGLSLSLAINEHSKILADMLFGKLDIDEKPADDSAADKEEAATNAQ